MLENYADLEVDKPCEDDCIILRQWADLEYADGSQANVDTGLQLHHLINVSYTSFVKHIRDAD